MTAREELRREMTHNHLYMTDERADELIDEFAHELAEEQRAALERGPGADWDYETGRRLSDLIDPRVGPASSEEPTA